MNEEILSAGHLLDSFRHEGVAGGKEDLARKTFAMSLRTYHHESSQLGGNCSGVLRRASYLTVCAVVCLVSEWLGWGLFGSLLLPNLDMRKVDPWKCRFWVPGQGRGGPQGPRAPVSSANRIVHALTSS